MVIISTTMLEIKEVSRSAHKVYFFVLFGSQNNQRLFPYAALPDRLLGAFAKLRKANISFVTPVRPHETTRLPPDGFS